jgi:hypothetical protein
VIATLSIFKGLSVTLVIAALTKHKIVLGADALHGVRQPDGSKNLTTGAKKFYKASSDWAILVAGDGFNLDKVDESLGGFIRDTADEHDLTVVMNALYRKSAGDVLPGFDGNLQFLLAGFDSKGEPRLVTLESTHGFSPIPVVESFKAAGRPEITEKLFRERKISAGTSLDEIKQAMNDAYDATTAALPHDVGGGFELDELDK